MTRKDFELIARAMRQALDEDPAGGTANAAYCLAERLMEAHPNFDERKFLLACGVQASFDERVEPLLDRA